MPIKLIPIGVFMIEPGETPKSIRDSLQQCWGLNFNSQIQETQTGRFLPDDEPIIDNREYYINFSSFPN
jgi:hypothetical protein